MWFLKYIAIPLWFALTIMWATIFYIAAEEYWVRLAVLLLAFTFIFGKVWIINRWPS